LLETKRKNKQNQNTNHHSPKEIGEDQPPPDLPGETKTLQLKWLRETKKKHNQEEGGMGASLLWQTNLIGRLSLFFLWTLSRRLSWLP
jgi:hypothetical protein